MIELSKVAAAHGGFYISHVRDEANKVFESYEEITRIGRDGNLPVEVSHIKLASTGVWHLAKTRMPGAFEKAKREGVDLKADVYPYTYWEATLRVIVTDRDFSIPKRSGAQLPTTAARPSHNVVNERKCLRTSRITLRGCIIFASWLSDPNLRRLPGRI